jgi:hypothetical protein
LWIKTWVERSELPMAWREVAHQERANPRNHCLTPSGGGESGIRTHGDIAATPVFKTGALNRSAISP